MLLQISQSFEALAARVTGKGFIVRVNGHVIGAGVCLLKRTIADVALVGTSLQMEPRVLPESDLMSKSLSTRVALVARLLAVRFLVHL